jgi:hypothetical protein
MEEFLPEAELSRRFRAAVAARVRELIGLGTPAADARAQARKEFSIYDLFLTDERGWVMIEGLDLSAHARKPRAVPHIRNARATSAKRKS